MLRLRVLSPAELTDATVATLESDPAVSGLAVLRGAAVRPEGDVVQANLAREAANDIVDRLREIGLHKQGSIELDAVETWLSRAGFDAELRTPGMSADAVVWADVTQRSYEDTELNWTY